MDSYEVPQAPTLIMRVKAMCDDMRRYYRAIEDAADRATVELNTPNRRVGKVMNAR
jgi:hypothetical protein